MSDAIEKEESNPTPQQWYVKIEDGSTFGPVGIDELRAWAETGRVAPGQLISHDRQDWLFAENLPDLEMVWRIELDKGSLYGPVNLQAIRALVADGTLSRKAVLINEVTHQKTSVARELDAHDLGESERNGPTPVVSKTVRHATRETARPEPVGSGAQKKGGADSNATRSDKGSGPEPSVVSSPAKARKPAGPPAGEKRVAPVDSGVFRTGVGPKQDTFARESETVSLSSDSPDGLRIENETLRRSLSQAKAEIEKYRVNIKKLQDYIHESADEISTHHDRLQKEYRLISSELVDTRMRLDTEAKATHDLQAEMKRKNGELEQMSGRYDRLFKDSQSREQDLLQRIEDIRKTANEASDKLDKAEWEFQRKAEAQSREIAVLTDVRSNLEKQWTQTKREAAEAREHWEQTRRDVARLEQEANASAQREDALRRETDEARAVIEALEKEREALNATIEQDARQQAELKEAGKQEFDQLLEQIAQLNQAMRDGEDALRQSVADAEAQQAAAESMRKRFEESLAQARTETDALVQERDACMVALQEKDRNIESARKVLEQKDIELAETRAAGVASTEAFADKEKTLKSRVAEQERALSALAAERDRLAKKLDAETQTRQTADTENKRLNSALNEERDRRGRAETERDTLRAALEKEQERGAGLAKQAVEQADAIAKQDVRIREMADEINRERARLAEADDRIRELQERLKDMDAQLEEGRGSLTREREESAACAERMQGEIQEAESRLSEALKEIEEQNLLVDNERTARRQCEEESRRQVETLKGQLQALSAELEKNAQDAEQQRVIQENEIEMLGIKLEDARQRSDHYKQEFEAAAARVEQQKTFYAEEREQRRRVESELMQAKNVNQDIQFQFRKKEREFVLERERIEGDLYRLRRKEQALLQRLDSIQTKGGGVAANPAFVAPGGTRKPDRAPVAEPEASVEAPDAD